MKNAIINMVLSLFGGCLAGIIAIFFDYSLGVTTILATQIMTTLWLYFKMIDLYKGEKNNEKTN